MVEAAPSAPLKVAEPDLLLELLIIALDAPAQLGGVDQSGERDVFRQGREPVPGRLVLVFGPLDQQPLFRWLVGTLVPRCDVNTHTGKSRGQPIIRAFPPLDGAPRFRRQSNGDVLDRGRIGRVAPPSLRCPAPPRPWRPYQSLRLN